MSDEIPQSDLSDHSEEGIAKIAAEIRDLRTACDILNVIIENAPDGIYVTDGDANAVRINPAFQYISGLPRKDMLGVNHRVLEREGVVARSSSLLALSEKKTVTIIHEYLTTGKQALVTSVPVFNDKNEIELIVSGTRDLTALNDVKSKLAAEQSRRLKYEEQLEKLLDQLSETAELIAVDKATLHLFDAANRVAKTEATILISGETGTGKEEIAKYIHNHSQRAGKPFIAINCGAIPESLLESELFGYVNGAFTGALRDGKMGLLEATNGGTVFLDEVGDLPLDMQVKLLRTLESRTITRIGSSKPVPLDIRIISATNRDLQEMVRENKFREDLYYRLRVVPIAMPALRDRVDDIIPLAKHFLDFFNKKYKLQKSFSPMVYRLMITYKWPGNVRELRNVVENMVVMSEADTITSDALPFYQEIAPHSQNNASLGPLKDRLERLEYMYMVESYAQYKNVRGAAAALGMTMPTFVRKRQLYERKYPDIK